MSNPNALNWFEIPVVDLDRAKRFYSTVLQAELREWTMDGMKQALLPYKEGGVGGALAQAEHLTPSPQGTVVYLDAGADLDGALARAQEAGGKIVLGKTRISEDIGWIAFVLDTEGNRIGLHSRP